MKSVTLITIMFFTLSLTAGETVSFARIEPASTTKDEALCKLFRAKAAEYNATMRDDAYAKATLASYEERVSLYCDK